jgi:hypothetical protein
VSQDPWSKAPQDGPRPEQQPHPEQPGYPAAPGYGYGPPPPYGAPGWGGPPAYPAVRPTNTLAIVALVMAFVFAPAAIVLGVIARRQIRETGEAGDGLALAGLILGIAFTVIVVALIVVWIVAFAALVGYAGTVST